MSFDLRAEFHGMSLGDRRLDQRALTILDRIAERPAASFPKVLPTAGELEGAYRFFQNDSVSPDDLLRPHIEATFERAREHEVIRVAHDTTTLSFGGEREGMGPIKAGGCGFEAHVSLAISGGEERAPLGVVTLATRVAPRRATATTKKAATVPGGTLRKWSAAPRALRGKLRGVRVIHVMDREGDCFALFRRLKQERIGFVIRGKPSRKTDPKGTEMVSDVLAEAEFVLRRRVQLTRRPDPKAGFSLRGDREALLSIRATTVQLKGGGLQDGQSVGVNVVEVVERRPPAGEEPTQWTLYTSEPVDTPEQMGAVVDHYRARWRIEEYFKALKTGCSIEKRQLTDFDSLKRALAMFLPVAWHLLALRTAAREDAVLPATTLLSPLQLVVLRALAAQRKFSLAQSPTVREALLAIACLGGHLKRNGEPGWKTIGDGYESLRAGETVWALAQLPPQEK